MGPTAEFVGRLTRLPAQVFTRLVNCARISFPEAARSRFHRMLQRAARLSVADASALLRLALYVAICFYVQPGRANDPYSSENQQAAFQADAYIREKNQRIAAEQQERFRVRVAIPEAVSDEVATAFAASRDARQNRMTSPPGSSVLASLTHRQALALGTMFILLGFLGVRKLSPKLCNYLNPKFNPWELVPANAASSLGRLRAEDEAFSEFLQTFQSGPTALPGAATFTAVADSAENDAIQEFMTKTPKLLSELQGLLQKINAATTEAARRTLLTDLHRELRVLKNEAGLPELLPVWQMTAALEGLVKQLIDKVKNVTPSTLRSVAGGVDLLKSLCVPGIRADLLSEPSLRLLAVDDDLISRNAVIVALKKALNPPELAENGEAALALASEHAYDVIFLDVQMPGLDGFEVCTRIHETILNATTPVVFITSQSDFEARAQSALSGGSDLICKPFLTFEITVKALTLALQRRLQAQAQTDGAMEGGAVTSTTPTRRNAPQSRGPEPGEVSAKVRLPELLLDDKHQSRSLITSAASIQLSAGELTRAFLARAAVQLGPMRDYVQVIFQTADASVRQEMLADVYLRLNGLLPAPGSAAKHPALRLGAALEGLIKKFLQDPKHCTSSGVLTIATALDLLHDLCATQVPPDFAVNPPIHILAVDDDPLARRAITSALQVAFEKPVSVDSGEAALARAAEQAFDVIFLDVEMPGMDGYTACSRIRETAANGATPVVFVTGHSDFKARSQATASGGSDLMGKPFLTAEITVRALTYALRGRLKKLKTAQNISLLPQKAESKPDNLTAATA